MTAGVTEGVTGRDGRHASAKIKKALPVERLLHWAYGVELVRGMPTWREGEGSGIDSGARSGCHGDALTLDALVTERLKTGDASLVRDHAVASTRPDWKPRARHRMGPLVMIEGVHVPSAQWFWSHPQACGCRGLAHLCSRREMLTWARGEKPGAYSPVYEFDSPAVVAQHRTRFYGRWWKALEVIRDALMQGDVLAAHIALPALPPQFPWAVKFPVDEAIRIG